MPIKTVCHWVPVTEALPPVGEGCWLALKNGHVKWGYRRDLSFFKGRAALWQGVFGVIETDRVVYWMAKPVAPLIK